MPSSPKKKRAVLTHIVANMDDMDKNTLINVITSNQKRTILSHEANSINVIVRNFLERDDISCISAKMKDVKSYTCHITRNKILLPTRHMVLSMKEAYALFIKERMNAEQGT